MSFDHDLIEDEGAGYLISVSDMMSGLLFVFIITLVSFIIHFQDAISQQNAVTGKLTASNELRTELLLDLQERLSAVNIIVDIDAEHGVLRLTENAIRFQSSKATLDEANQLNLNIIAGVFTSVLPCYGEQPPQDGTCKNKEGLRGQLDAVFIEGHTDNVPISSKLYADNWDLSVQRAIQTFRLLVPPKPLLNSMLNTNGQPIFSVSGYGEGRPVEGHDHEWPTNDVANRRIDIRFLMSPPSLTRAQRDVMDKGAN